jgi:hypothetical protein
MARMLQVFQSVAKWCTEFQGIGVSTDDCERSSRPTRARTADNSALEENVICSNNSELIPLDMRISQASSKII